VALTTLSAIGAGAALAAPAQAIWWAPTPPSCHTDSRWINVGSSKKMQVYLYAYAFKYTTKRSSSRGVAHTTYYVYDVQNVFYPVGLVTVGRAERLCRQTVR
jgi:hypothetical protein